MSKSATIYLIPSTLASEATDTIPEQTRQVLLRIDYFLVENLRSARRYISSLKLGLTIEDLQFETYDKHTTFEDLLELLLPLKERGGAVGIISEAGLPGIADPGATAVQAAHQLNIKVVPLSGPSSIFMALMASGFNGQSFVFHGYLPIDKEERKKYLRQMESELSQTGRSQIFMETPYRNMALFQSILDCCRPDTQLCIAAALTSEKEFIETHSVEKWKRHKVEIHKIPAIFIIGN